MRGNCFAFDGLLLNRREIVFQDGLEHDVRPFVRECHKPSHIYHIALAMAKESVGPEEYLDQNTPDLLADFRHHWNLPLWDSSHAYSTAWLNCVANCCMDDIWSKALFCTLVDSEGLQ